MALDLIANHDTLKRHCVVAFAEETLVDPNGEIDGCFTWVAYTNNADYLAVGRLDNMSGVLRFHCGWDYTDGRSYARCFALAMTVLFERSTGYDIRSAAPRR